MSGSDRELPIDAEQLRNHLAAIETRFRGMADSAPVLIWMADTARSFTRVDIIVSDIGMPDIDGYELIRRIRRQKPCQNTMAIALTAYARPEDRQHALLAGYQMHLAKSVESRELIAGIASLLNLRGRPG